MARQYKCECGLCLRYVTDFKHVCKQCLTDAKQTSHVLSTAREHVPSLLRAPDPVVASRMWLRLAPEVGKERARELVKRYHTAWQLELGEKPDPDWNG